jgi:hypothetical protein
MKILSHGIFKPKASVSWLTCFKRLKSLLPPAVVKIPIKKQANEAGGIMLDILVGLFLASVGLCLVLGSIALTSWRAGYTKQDMLKIIDIRNDKAKTTISDIDPNTFN